MKNTENLNNLVIEKFEKANQGHLFNLEMSLAEQKDLEDQLKSLPEPSVLNSKFKEAMESNSLDFKFKAVKPVDKEDILVSVRGSNEREEWYKIGLEAIGKGEVGVVTLAGGQGTRLGSSEPKGCYKIGLPSGSSLFRIQAEKVKKLEQLSSVQSTETEKKRIYWYIMTSEPTHESTVKYFTENKNFGLESDQVKFFQQGVLPAFDLEGKILLKNRGKISLAPDGNGGIFKALEREGILEDMRQRGIKYVHMYCVDNCLVKVGDPSFVGACIVRGTDCGAKCVEKMDPLEPVGVFCRNSGDKIMVAEYSELDEEKIKAINPESGKLLFSEANIANHFFTLKFLNGLSGLNLPYHVARKKIPTIDPCSGEFGITEGMKLEAFIFDVFEFAKSPFLFRVSRDEEFAPLKNAPGAPKDSPEFCANQLYSLHQKYLQEANVKFDPNLKYEISSILSYEGEGLEKLILENDNLSPGTAIYLK